MWVFVESCKGTFYAFLRQLLAQEHIIGEFKGGSGFREGEVMLCRGRLPRKISVSRCIYLPMQRNRMHPIQGEVLVVCSDDAKRGMTKPCCYPCGFSQEACLTISSKTEEQLVISLSREVQSVYGRKIEPFDLPVQRIKGLSDTELLYAYMTKLLLYPAKR